MTTTAQSNVLSTNDIRSLVSSYCFATPSESSALVLAHPQLFQGELLECLDDARELMRSTGSAYDESQKMFMSLLRQLDLPGGDSSVATLVDTVEGNSPLAADSLRPITVAEAARKKGSDVCRFEFDMLLQQLLKDGETASPLQRECVVTTTSAPSSSSWICRDEAVTWSILSFLPAADVFNACENVCSTWRRLLCDGPVANSFWIGVVQREFPEQMDVLLSSPVTTSGGDPWDQDWRVIAMMAVCNADGTTDEVLQGLAPACDDDGDAQEG
jgi:hypothetical protein